MCSRATGWAPVDRAGVLGDQRIVAVAEDEQGTLWFASDHGLAALRGERLERVALPRGCAGAVDSMIAARGGGLWLVSGEQLYRFRAGAAEPLGFDVEQFGEPYWLFADTSQRPVGRNRAGARALRTGPLPDGVERAR